MAGAGADGNLDARMSLTADISVALSVLRDGGIVAFPTDTVWGVGVSAAYAASPQAIFDAKGRPSHKPVAWLVGGADALDVYGGNVPDYARNIAYAFWPGAVTIVVPASDAVPEPFKASDGTVALRMPAHAGALELARKAGPLATSSANLSGRDSAVSAATLDPAIAAAVACVFDDGSTSSGIASTVVRCIGPSLEVIRQGDVVL